MASTSSPYGFQPISDQAGTPRPLRIPNGIVSGYGANIFAGEPVKLVIASGTLQAVTATTDAIFGVFVGVEIITPVGGQPTPQSFWASGQTYDTTQDMWVYVWPCWNPNQRFQVQADGTVAQALLGSQFNTSNFAAGSTTVGLSQATVAAAGVGTGTQGQWVLQEFYPGINSAVGDAYTDLIVSCALPQIGPGYQTSIG